MSEQKKTAYIIPLQHFDIIWRRPISYYRQIQRELIKRVLDAMDAYPEFRFTLDQAYVLRYFAENNPEYADKLRQAGREHRLLIAGGLETIPDTNMVSGESLVRNMMYGRQWTESFFGFRPHMASLMDCFGTSGQIPAILAGTGQEILIDGRMPGINLRNPNLPSAYIWKGLDGSTIRGIHLGFDNIPPELNVGWFGAGVSNTSEELKGNNTPFTDSLHDTLDKGLQAFMESASTEAPQMAVMSAEENLLQPDAVDQVVAFMHEHKGAPIALGTFEEYAEETDWDKAESIEGEHNAEFTGCYTTRIELKQWNQAMETLLYNVEFIYAAAVLSGAFTADPESRKGNWRDLFLCQFHDALCGCHIDDNYHDIMAAFNLIRDEAGYAITAAFNPYTGANKFTVLNTLPFARTEIVRIESSASQVRDNHGNTVPCQRDNDRLVFTANLEPTASRTYQMNQSNHSAVEPIGSEVVQVGQFGISLHDDRLEITDTRNDNRRLFMQDDIPMKIVLKEDVGTLWTENFTGKVVAEEPGDSVLVSAEVGSVFAKMVFSGEIPKSRVPWDSFEKLTWKKTIYVYHDLDRVDAQIDINFDGKGTEISTVFPLELNDLQARAVYEIPFGSIERKPYTSDKYRWARGNWPALSWIDYSDADWGVTIAHTGTPGCLAVDGQVSFSILRSATVAEPPIFPTEPEPLSFDNGHHHYEFSLIPHEFGSDEWLRHAKKFVVRPVVAKSDGLALPLTRIEINQPNVIISSLKPAEDGNGVVLRVYEALGKPCTTCITVDASIKRAFETSLDEHSIIGDIDLTAVEMKPFNIKTIMLR
ncbi:MAG: glycoside hydrolase family 38 N-terminal domain-containing protein [Armatimonadota bacterium]